jgi:hypothetical protein
MDGDSNKKHRKEYQHRCNAHTERKKAHGGQKDPLTQESYASDFDEIDGLEAQETIIDKRFQKFNSKMQDFDKEANKNPGENGKKTAGNSKDDAIAID